MTRLVVFFKSNFFVLGILILVYLFTVFVRSPFPPYEKDDKREKNFILSDGVGYYSYLPATFIYKDLSFSFFNEAYKKNYETDPPGWITAFMVKTDTGIVDKYWIGESLLLLPFFLIAHWLSLLFGVSADGYSTLYQYAVFFAALFYLVLGCRFIYRFLQSYGFSKTISNISILTIVLGTNLYYYTMYEPAMSHVYSFFCISGFIYFGSRFFKNYDFKDLTYAALLMILIVLVRPVNAITIVFIPFMAGSWQSLFEGIKRIFSFKLKLLIPASFIILLLLQMFIWHHQCNKWIVWSYPGEEFFFLNPHYFDILFSYRKGFFVYMPICFVSLLGLFYLLRNKIFWFYSITISMAFVIYILSSWYAWDYSACLGNRAFIDFYFIFALLIAFSYQVFKNKFGFWVLTIIYTTLLLFNHIQTYQYRHHIYHNMDMDKKGYWEVFLQTSKGYENILYDWSDKADMPRLLQSNRSSFFTSKTNFETQDSLWTSYHPEEQAFALSGKKVSMVNDAVVYGDGIHIPEIKIPVKQNVIIETNLSAYLNNDLAGAYIVHQVTNNGNSIYWKTSKIYFKNTPIKKWTQHTYLTEIIQLNPGDELVVFILNAGNSSLYFDDIEVKLCTYK